MPAISSNSYHRPVFLFNGHLETIYPALFRKVNGLPQPEYARLNTPDHDFLEYDLYSNQSDRILLLQHGLEGDATRPYMLGMVKAFLGEGYDVCSWNFRGCKEMNLQPYFYHSGSTPDLEVVVNHFKKTYQDITLVGFSLGGNLTLKYLGETIRPVEVKRAVVFSVPMDLDSGADNLSGPHCYIYEQRFLRLLREKIKKKAAIMPDQIDLSLLDKVKSIRDFDEYYTGPMNGFEGAADYYQQCSSIYYLEGIKTPTLIVNALNDPLLTRESLDHRLTRDLKNVWFETSLQGGHVGFTRLGHHKSYWSEERAVNFCKEYQ